MVVVEARDPLASLDNFAIEAAAYVFGFSYIEYFCVEYKRMP